ncbi:MAG TPA: hypothetical protein VJ819_05000 [Nocardioidaceae bacterium]|nr:hypothetical protein [Nocardioidaceae bacterium]
MTGTSTYDFDLHGIVGIRLLDATPEDLAKVGRQLGPLRRELDREPDISIRFVDETGAGRLTCVGLGDTGFDANGFFALRGAGGVRGKALLPLDRIGRHPVIVCERRLPAVPHLLPVINFTALGKGVLPLHASAFTSGSTGVLVTGWAKSGKTESLLAGMAQGADYIGDEWVYLTPDRQMLGLPEPIRLWGWHFEQLPSLLQARPRRDRIRLSVWQAAAAAGRAGSKAPLPGSALLRKGAPALDRQTYLQVPPAELFGSQAIALRGSLDAVVLVLSGEATNIDVGRAGPQEVSGRMRASLADERAPFMAHYRQFQYAFPGRHSEAVEAAPATEARLLAELFDHRPAARVVHPYPCDIAELGRAVLAAAHDMPAAPTTGPEVVAS